MNFIKLKMVTSFAFFMVALAVASSSDLVRVNFYGESLCPDCIAYSTGPMDLAIKQVGDIFKLTYIPSGNAHMHSDGTITCQHGPMECLINKVEACVVHYYPSREEFWPFVYCMMSNEQSQDLKIAEKCATSNSLDWDKINSCTNGDMGKSLQLQAFNVTASLNPPHHYTPWVTVNGMHSVDAEGFHLISVICQAYSGPNKPSAC